MKKFEILLLSLCVATPALADLWTNCTNNGGTVIQANSYGNDKGGLCNDPSDSNLTTNCNGKRFCKSGNKMNWWSAFTWCESIGGRLVSFGSMCPGIQTKPNNVAGACPNLKGTGTGYVWANMGWENYMAINLNLSNGAIGWSNYGGNTRTTDYRNNAGITMAFCEEK